MCVCVWMWERVSVVYVCACVGACVYVVVCMYDHH